MLSCTIRCRLMKILRRAGQPCRTRSPSVRNLFKICCVISPRTKQLFLCPPLHAQRYYATKRYYPILQRAELSGSYTKKAASSISQIMISQICEKALYGYFLDFLYLNEYICIQDGFSQRYCAHRIATFSSSSRCPEVAPTRTLLRTYL